MSVVVGVAFKRPGKVYFFDPDGFDVSLGDQVVVRTAKGIELGEITSAPTKVPEEQVVRPLKKITRMASSDDLERFERNRTIEKDAFEVCQQKIAEHNLDMRVVDVEMVFDRSKITFHFLSEDRVDFRELVRELASRFKARIEMRQLGVRDKARKVGGLGSCGRQLCCEVFLGDLNPVSIRMAKEQNLPLNPTKISGVCGRLMCCLRYEFEAYRDFRKRAPKRGACVETCTGTCGKVVNHNVLKESLGLVNDENKYMEVPLADIKKAEKPKSTRKEPEEVESPEELDPALKELDEG